MVKKAPVKKKKTLVRSKTVAPKKPVRGAKQSVRPRSPPQPTSEVAEVPDEGAVLPEVHSRFDDRLLTLSFLRDGDEFCVRLELANGQITEFKNRSPDQLLTMVAGELEDLLG